MKKWTTMFALAAMAIGYAEAQQISFTIAPSYGTLPAPQAIELADMDGDGDLDAVTVEYADGISTVSVAKNRGDGSYDPASSYPVGEGAKYLAIGDFNVDSRPDVVVSNTLSGDNAGNPTSYVTVYMNNGAGGLIGRRELPVGESANTGEIVVADFDQDGRPDFAITAMMMGKVYVYRSSGSGNFALLQAFNAPVYAYIEKADINGDGRPDLIVGDTDHTWIYTNNAVGGFNLAQFMDNGSDGVSGICAADFDGDGDIDYVTSGRSLCFFRNIGGVFTKVGYYSTGRNLTGLRAADLDGDGDIDVAGSLYLGNSVSVYYNNAFGSFDERADWGVGDNPQDVAIGDVNGDGRRDLVAPSSSLNATDFTVVLNAGDKFFVARREYGLIGQAAGADMADFDGDGFKDMVTGVYVGNQDRVAVFYGLSDGSHEDAVYIENFGNNIPTDVVVADFNHDGRPDIAASIMSPGNRVRVFMNLGNRTFAPSVSLPAGADPWGVGAGDMNGDSYPEIVVANRAITDNSIHVFWNNGNGTFQPGIRIPTFPRPNDATFGDFDKDGDMDFVITHEASNNILVFRSNGVGGLTQQTIDAGYIQGNAAVGDFNGDTWPDIALASGYVRLLLNNGAGGFGTPQEFPIPAGRIAAADFDGDSDLDVVGTYYVMSQACVGQNNGQGTFTLVHALKSGYLPDRVATGDLDGDGKPEIVTANYGALTVFKNATQPFEMIVIPSSFNLYFGVLLGGTVQSLALSDDSRLWIGGAVNGSRSTPNVQLEIIGTSPTAQPAQIKFDLEAQSDLSPAGGVTQRVELFNFVSGAWVQIDQRFATTTDSLTSITVPGQLSQFIQAGTRLLRARFTWLNGKQFSRTQGVKIDQCVWRVR